MFHWHVFFVYMFFQNACKITTFFYTSKIVCITKCSAARAAGDALNQIDEMGYATPYEQPGHRVVRIGAAFARDSRTIERWIVAK